MAKAPTNSASKSAAKKRLNSEVISEIVALYHRNGKNEQGDYKGFSEKDYKKIGEHNRGIMFVVETQLNFIQTEKHPTAKASYLNSLSNKMSTSADNRMKVESDEEIALNNNNSDEAKKIADSLLDDLKARDDSSKASEVSLNDTVDGSTDSKKVSQGSKKASKVSLKDTLGAYAELSQDSTNDSQDSQVYPNETFARLEMSAEDSQDSPKVLAKVLKFPTKVSDINDHLALPPNGLMSDTDGFSEELQSSPKASKDAE